MHNLMLKTQMADRYRVKRLGRLVSNHSSLAVSQQNATSKALMGQLFAAIALRRIRKAGREFVRD
jgi:hypothetical protein